MRLSLLLFALFLFSLTACTKSELFPIPSDTVATTDLEGKFGPFGKGSTWEYQYIQCDANHTPICTPALISFTHGEPYDLNQYQIVDLYGQRMHIKEGKYHEVWHNQLILTMVENPTVGMTWSSKATLVDEAGQPLDKTYQFRVVAVGSSLTIAAGTFNKVVEVEALITGKEAGTATFYYQEGVGLLKKVYQQDRTYSISYELLNYNIQ